MENGYLFFSTSESFLRKVTGNSLTFSHSCGIEGNGTPLQYSGLENPMGAGAW